MQWKTAITRIEGNHEWIRGHELTSLVEKYNFVDVIFLVLRGNLPEKHEARMLNALFVAAIDHGIGTASAMTARIVTSAKNSMHTALAAGILAMGDIHGGAIEGAAKFFQEHAHDSDTNALVKSYKDHGLRIPGYGHAVLSQDERSETLIAIAREEKIYGVHCALAEAVGKSLNSQSSKVLPLNIDGAMGAVLSDMGFDWKMMRGVFIIARLPGLVAHVYEEMCQKNGLRRLDEEEIIHESVTF